MTIENQPDLKNEFIQNIFINSPIGIYIVQDGKFCFVNSEFQKTSGFTLDELIGMESLSIILPEDVDLVRKNAVKMLKGERRSPYLYRVIEKNGEMKWIIESLTSVKYGGRRATLGYFMDNTQREMAEEAMRISEDKFHKAFRLSPEWVVISTIEDGFYIDVNKTFLQATGYSREEVVGSTSIDLGIWVDLDDRSRMVDLLNEEGKVRNLETRFRLKSGEIRSVLWSAESIDYGDEKCLIAVTRDITDRKKAEQERLDHEKLQGVLEMAGATCHELNQPIQVLFCLIDELRDVSPESDIIQKLEEQLHRMKEITSKVNNITAYETKDYVEGVKIIDITKASKQE